MKIQLVGACALCAVINNVSVAQSASVAWENSFAGIVGDNDWGASVVVAPSGQIYVAGTTFEEESATSTVLVPRLLTLSIAPNGSTTWSRVFGLGSYSGNGTGSHVALQPSGRVVVAGSKDLGEDWIVAGYEPNGTLAWSGAWEANSWFMSEPADMALDAAGNIYLCGDYGDPSLGTVGGVAKFNANGQLAWARALDTTTEMNSARGLALDSAGSVYLTGLRFDGIASDRFAVVKLDSAGTHVWSRLHGSTNSGASSIGIGIGVDANGRVLAAGHGSSPTLADSDLLTVAYDPQGTLLWNSSFDGGAGLSEIAEAVAFDAQGRIFVAASTNVSFNDLDALVVAFGANGSVAWSSLTTSPLSFDQPLTIATDGSGTALVAGLSISSSGWTGFARLHFQGGPALSAFSFGANNGRSFLRGSASGPNHRWCVTGERAPLNADANALTVAIDNPTTNTYCTAGTSTLGCSATLSSSGTPHAAATSGFVLTATGLDAQRQGMIFYGVSGRIALAWGATSSFLCVKTPTQRTPVANSGGTPGACDGTISIDWSQFVAQNAVLGTPFQAGSIVQSQAWYRDPPSSKSTALSDALEFTVQP